MSYYDRDNAGHDLIKAALAMTEHLPKLDLTKPVPVEDVLELGRLIGCVEERAAALGKLLGPDYRDRVGSDDQPSNIRPVRLTHGNMDNLREQVSA